MHAKPKHHPFPSSRALCSVIILFLCFVSGYVSINVIRNTSVRLEEKETKHAGTATSGRLFTGKKIRTFPRNQIQFSNYHPQMQPKQLQSWSHQRPCSKWSVTTTIFEVSEAMKIQTRLPEDWCMVIVGDKRGEQVYPINEGKKGRVIYLNVKDQEELENAGVKLIKHLPWNSFGRKNLGYLYAIASGAELIWDFDDDNALISEPPHILVPQEMKYETILVEAKPKSANLTCDSFNPMPLMGVENLPSWPRGLPLLDIKAPACQPDAYLINQVSVPTEKIAVFQSLANHDPDVDAIYRLTQPLPFDFVPVNDEVPLLVPQDAYSPFNAQATLFTYEAMFMLILPLTVHGRVSDIWRSYFGQRLLKDIGSLVVFTHAQVVQDRNDHNYLGDLDSELDLYMKSGKLVEHLKRWSSTCKSLECHFESLIISLYEHEYLDIGDVKLIQTWIESLHEVGYQFPLLQTDVTEIIGYQFPLLQTDVTEIKSEFGIAGGVLPIKRFQIVGGKLIKTLTKAPISTKRCNDKCLETRRCDAWQVISNKECQLYADDSINPLDIYQAEMNNPDFIVGFIQRRAGVLRPLEAPGVGFNRTVPDHMGGEDEVSSRILYILHFHHFVDRNVLSKLLNEILPSSWYPFMDLVVISPREVPLEPWGIHNHPISSLRNPFRPRDESKRGANSYMSLPIASAKFPGYKGYILMNDDAFIKPWVLKPDTWFGDRPWGTFNMNTVIRMGKENPGSWWWPSDSGSGSMAQSGKTRSNFDATLGALNELCTDDDIMEIKGFCDGRNSTYVPFLQGKADLFYIPGNRVGWLMTKSIILFGEHDVFLEIAIPIIMALIVGKGVGIQMPYCEFSHMKENITKEDLTHECPSFHPMKLSIEKYYGIWKKVVNSDCPWCRWPQQNETSWKVLEQNGKI